MLADARPFWRANSAAPSAPSCTRGDIDEPIAIDEIKKFIAQQDLNAETRYVPTMLNTTGKPLANKIAIIGAGPAGHSSLHSRDILLPYLKKKVSLAVC
jgi:hypothetical protein